MVRLLLLFILVPAIELVLLIELGARIGTLPTIALIVLTGVVGSSLARWQGLEVLRRVQHSLQTGELPASALGDGLFILLASALLVTPGVLTDIVGFGLLVPPVRAALKGWLWNRFRGSIRAGNLHVQMGGGPMRNPGSVYHADDVIDVEATTIGKDSRG